MGDAFIPLADDGATALFYNPAGFGKIRKPSFEPFNFQMQPNSQFVENVGLDIYKFSSLSSYAPTLSGNPGSFPGFSTMLLPNFSFRGFGFGMLMGARVAAVSDGTNVRYRSKYQVIPAVGGGLRLASGVLRVGYSLQWVNQASGERTVPLSSSPLGYNQGLAQGSALSHNVGAALTLPYQYLPSINLVARNLLGAKYSSYTFIPLAKNTEGVPETELMTLDAGLGLVNKFARGVALNTVLELRDATNVSGMSIFTRAALGLELSFRESFFIRGGIGSGYPSAGMGFKTPKGEMNLGWFSEETGSGLRSERDSRYILHYSIRAF
jgi:hypothetical protein